MVSSRVNFTLYFFVLFKNSDVSEALVEFVIRQNTTPTVVGPSGGNNAWRL
jgi:hypothetical protein